MDLIPESENFRPHDSLARRLTPDGAGGYVIRWATQKPEEEDQVPIRDMLGWFANERQGNRLPDGQLADVCRVAGHLVRLIHLDAGSGMVGEATAVVDYALIERSEESYSQAVTALRVPILAQTEEAHAALPGLITQALRFASCTQYPAAIDVCARLHVAAAFGRETADPGVALDGLVNLLSARLFGEIPFELLCRAYETFVLVLEEYDSITVTSDKIPAYAGPDFAAKVIARDGAGLPSQPPTIQVLDFIAA